MECLVRADFVARCMGIVGIQRPFVVLDVRLRLENVPRGSLSSD